MIVDLFTISAVSIWNNKLRSFLTMLGIIIGVFAVMTLMSIGEGVRDDVSSSIEGLGSNIVMVVPGNVNSEESGGFTPGSVVGVSPLTSEDVTAVRSRVDHIQHLDAGTIVTGNLQSSDGRPVNAFVVGTGTSLGQILEKKIAAGRWLNQEDIDVKARVAVLDSVPQQALFPDLSPEETIGQRVIILQEEITVVGVGESLPNTDSLLSSSTPLDTMVAIPLTLAQELQGSERVDRIFISVTDTDLVEETVTQTEEVLLDQHKGEKNFSVLTQEDLLEIFNEVLGIITQAIGGIAAISLIVGGIGIMNIMLVAVSERTKEIGIRKAVGATDGNILSQFLIEASALSLFGGLIGFLLSVIVSTVVERYFNIPTAITVKAILLAVGISIGVGIIFGIAPATKAAKKNPIDALRYE
ncbi:MAG: ABC transporter permease [bacterium]|nr:ABC transporter permease [bacterium]